MDHYEIKRMRDEIKRMRSIIEDYAETIMHYVPDIDFCSQCEFAKNEDDLTEVNEGEVRYCETCVDKCIERGEVGVCEKCGDCFTIENLEKIGLPAGDFYCDDCAYHM